MAEQWAIRLTWRDGGEQLALDPGDPRRVWVFGSAAEAERRGARMWQLRGGTEIAALDVVPYVEPTGGRTGGDP